MSISTTKKLAVALLGAAALVTFANTGNAVAGGFNKFEHEHRHFHFGHWGRDRFYGGECFYVLKPWGIAKVCPDYDSDDE